MHHFVEFSKLVIKSAKGNFFHGVQVEGKLVDGGYSLLSPSGLPLVDHVGDGHDIEVNFKGNHKATFDEVDVQASINLAAGGKHLSESDNTEGVVHSSPVVSPLTVFGLLLNDLDAVRDPLSFELALDLSLVGVSCLNHF